MHKIQRMIIEVVLTLVVFALISSISSVSRAEPSSDLSGDSELTGSTVSKSLAPKLVWPLGIAVVRLAIFGRKST